MYFVCFSFIGNSLRHIYSQLATSRFFFYLFSTPTSVITKNHKLPSTRVHLYAKKNSINRVPQKLLFFRRLFCAQSFLLSVCVCVCVITTIPPFTWQNEEFYFAKNSICRIQFQNASILYLPFSFDSQKHKRNAAAADNDEKMKKILLRPTLDESEKEKIETKIMWPAYGG